MKAIVLTCDKYLKFADHMILTYQKVWPTHPFTFRVPCGTATSTFEKYGDRVDLMQMDSAKMDYDIETETGTKKVSLIRQTVLNLLEDLPDEEWIYWCIDDRYLMRIQEKEMNDIYDFVINNTDSSLLAVLFSRNRKSSYFKGDKHIKKDIQYLTSQKQVLKETIYSDGKFLPDLFGHQFIKVKALRRIFESFPDRPFLGKEMDSFAHGKLIGEKQLIVENNLVIWGESTSRGQITENCVASFKKWKMELPSGFTISNIYAVTGELPYQWLGLKFTLPERMEQFVEKVTRWYWRTL